MSPVVPPSPPAIMDYRRQKGSDEISQLGIHTHVGNWRAILLPAIFTYGHFLTMRLPLGAKTEIRFEACVNSRSIVGKGQCRKEGSSKGLAGGVLRRLAVCDPGIYEGLRHKMVCLVGNQRNQIGNQTPEGMRNAECAEKSVPHGTFTQSKDDLG